MDILDRYLQAIGEYLPAAGKEDTLAELRANLLALIEDREEQLGRPLNGDELVEIIRNHGRPVVVASRYLPQQWLIGPELFPFYRLALRRSLPLVILFYFSAQAVSLLFHDHGRVDIGAAIGAAGDGRCGTSEGILPRRARDAMAGGFVAGFSVCAADPRAAAGIRSGRAADASARHRGNDGHVWQRARPDRQ